MSNFFYRISRNNFNTVKDIEKYGISFEEWQRKAKSRLEEEKSKISYKLWPEDIKWFIDMLDRFSKLDINKVVEISILKTVKCVSEYDIETYGETKEEWLLFTYINQDELENADLASMVF